MAQEDKEGAKKTKGLLDLSNILLAASISGLILSGLILAGLAFSYPLSLPF